MKKILCIAIMAVMAFSLAACSPAFFRDAMVELDKHDYNDSPSLAEKLDEVDVPEAAPVPSAVPSAVPVLPEYSGEEGLTFATLDPLGIISGDPMTGAELTERYGFEAQDGLPDGYGGIYRKDIPAPEFADAGGENYAETLEEDGAIVFASYYYDISAKNSASDGLYDFINSVEDAVSAELGAEKSSGMIYFGGEDMDYEHSGRLTEAEAAQLAAGDSEGYGYTMYGCSWTTESDMLDIYFSVMNDRVRMNIMRSYGGLGKGTGETENVAEIPSTTDVAGGYEFSALSADNPRPITTAEEIAADPGVKTGSSIYSQFTEYTKPMDIMGRQGEMYVVAEKEKIYTIGYEISSAASDTPEDIARLYSEMAAFCEEIAGRAPDEALRDDNKQLNFDEVLAALKNGESAVFETTWQMDGYTLNAVLMLEDTGSSVSMVYYFD